MDKLTREEVEHVADLAKLALTEEEIEKYRVELKQLIDDIDKVKDIKNYDEDFLIAPFSILDRYTRSIPTLYKRLTK